MIMNITSEHTESSEPEDDESEDMPMMTKGLGKMKHMMDEE